jgi:CubicO group peptidase (beta-lactamase class C family)
MLKKIAAIIGTILCCTLVARADEPATQPENAPTPKFFTFGVESPENESVDITELIALTQWVKSNNDPILSILISRNGKVVYQLYTSGLDPQEAHYIFSASKSVLSALTGVCIDRKLLPPTSTPINQMLPRDWFPSDTAYTTFGTVTLKDVLAMSALDAPIAPHFTTPEAIKRNLDYFYAENRTKYALTQKVFRHPGKDFLYTDVTCALVSGAIECATHQSLFDFGNSALFEPMGFENQEWMHEDRSGIDNGAYGLRLRPIDMQKFGVLYLNQGTWDGKQLISPAWVHESYHPWIATEAMFLKHPNYGSYWWKVYHAPNGWTGEDAIGWKGQYIAVFSKWNTVVTMTALFEDNGENAVFTQIIKNFVAPAIVKKELYVRPDEATLAAQKQQLAALLDQIQSAPSRLKRNDENRVIPSIEPKESHHPFEGGL